MNNKQNYNQFFRYVFIILITMNISFFILKGSSDSSFVENFNFASTITSIILSVIAIVYTFVDSSDSKHISTQIISSAEEIKQSIEDLEKVRLDIKSSVENMSALEETITGVIREESAITQDIISESFISRQNEIIETKHSVENYKKILDLTKDADIKYLANSITLHTKQYCLLIYLSYVEKLDFNIFNFAKFFSRRTSKYASVDVNICYRFLGSLELLGVLNLIDVAYNDNNISVNSISDKFEILVNEFKELNDYDDYRERIYLGSVYEYFASLKEKTQIAKA